MRTLQEQFLTDKESVGKETERLWTALEKEEAFATAGTILLYMSIPGEVATGEFIRKWYPNKRIAIPLVVGDSLILKEYNPDLLHEGYKGILEPSDDSVTILPENIDLAVVPGIAFTQSGKRLGRGGGFYDRLIPALHCPVFGICYPFRIVKDLPTEPWDRLLTKVIS